MPIQIEQTLPKCRRCGKMSHARDPQRIDDGDLVFCSVRCQSEYRALSAEASDSAEGKGGSQ